MIPNPVFVFLVIIGNDVIDAYSETIRGIYQTEGSAQTVAENLFLHEGDSFGEVSVRVERWEVGGTKGETVWEKTTEGWGQTAGW